MKITEFRVGMARTINLGNYESLRIDVSVAVAPQEGDDIVALRAEAQAELRRLAEETYRAQNKRAQENHQP